jgi:gliding motility-associated lipoprotein GldH
LYKTIRLRNIYLSLLAACSLQLVACSIPSGVFEKDVNVPGQQWESGFRPQMEFTIKDEDTARPYNTYLVLRHTDAYNYNNIWISVTFRGPGDSTARTRRFDLPLATNDLGWNGTGMDDIYEHRLPLELGIGFKIPGTYSFTIEQIMREDPLKHILDVGIRVEAAK